VAAAVAAATLALVVVSGCATPRVALGTSQSPCFQALPVAIEAVGRQGQFAGVRRVTRSTLGVPGRLGLPRPNRPSTTTTTRAVTSGATTTTRPRVPPQSQGVCEVAFKGTFDRTRIPLLVPSSATGRYAVVVVSIRTRRARAVYLIDYLPKAFTHL
jgi:hypothetical protein